MLLDSGLLAGLLIECVSFDVYADDYCLLEVRYAVFYDIFDVD